MGVTSTEPRSPSAVRGSLWVAIGLGVFGLAGFVLLGLAGRELGPAGSVPVTVAWTAVNALGIGLFIPVEQEISRLAASRYTLDQPPPDLRHVINYVGALSVIVLLISVAFAAPIADLLFTGHQEMVWVVSGALIALAIQYMVRGSLSGTGRFMPYGAQLAIDGVVRIVWCSAVFVLPGGSALTYGLCFIVAPLVAAAVTAFAVPRTWLLSPATRGHTAPLTMLVLTSLSSQLLANAGPLAISAQAGPAETETAGNFVAAITIARMPLFVFGAVQAVFLPTLSALIAARNVAGYRTTVGRLLAATTVLGLGGVAAIAIVGHWLLRLIYGPQFSTTLLDLVLIAVSGALFMAAQACAQVLLAHRADQSVLIAWAVGLVATVIVLMLPGGLTTRAALALCAGAGTAAVLLGITLIRVASAWSTSSKESQ